MAQVRSTSHLSIIRGEHRRDFDSAGACGIYSDSIRLLSSQKASKCGGDSMSAYGQALGWRSIIDRCPRRFGRSAGPRARRLSGLFALGGREAIGDRLWCEGSASDLVQETFLEAQRDSGRFRGRSGPEVRGWLRQILLHNVNVFANRYRATGKRDVGREVGLVSAGLDRPARRRPRCLERVTERQTGRPRRGRNIAVRARKVARRLSPGHRPAAWKAVSRSSKSGKSSGAPKRPARKVWVRAMESLRQQWASSQ